MRLEVITLGCPVVSAALGAQVEGASGVLRKSHHDANTVGGGVVGQVSTLRPADRCVS
ncbi:hypothetical protein [Streptomyces sp. NPDC002851]